MLVDLILFQFMSTHLKAQWKLFCIFLCSIYIKIWFFQTPLLSYNVFLFMKFKLALVGNHFMYIKEFPYLCWYLRSVIYVHVLTRTDAWHDEREPWHPNYCFIKKNPKISKIFPIIKFKKIFLLLMNLSEKLTGVFLFSFSGVIGIHLFVVWFLHRFREYLLPHANKNFDTWCTVNRMEIKYFLNLPKEASACDFFLTIDSSISKFAVWFPY